ncbi:MAG: DUF4160 domain-containing protein [Cyclobacterium sp.]|uniref:DUF4160 domain-containing protein n=1 Tax=Cyclobacterium sp. TaxID=1966343 RepID=UPI0039707939
MPTVLRIGPFRFFFFSNEGNEPPHIHVESGEGHAKFWLEPVELANSTNFSPPELNKLRKLTEEHKELILKNWHEYFNR